MSAASFDDLAAALRARIDVTALGSALLETLDASLPAQLVTVERSATVRQRMRGQPGTIRRLTVRCDDESFALDLDDDGSLRPRVEHVVHGVTLSRTPVALDAWIDRLAAALGEVARRDVAAREALERLLFSP